MSTASEQAALPARLREWVRLVEEKRALEGDLQDVQDKLSAVEPGLLEDMALAGMKSASVDGMLIYRQREFTAALKPEADKPAVFAEWLAAGHSNLLMLGWQSLRGYVRELQEAGEPLPEEVAKYVEVGDVFRLRSRKA